jgi:hypothetical protein
MTDCADVFRFIDGAKQLHFANTPFAYYQNVPLTMEDFGRVFEELARNVSDLQFASQTHIDKQYNDIIFERFWG